MDRRKIIIKQSVAESIAAIAWYIESKGMIATAEKFVDQVYDYFEKLADTRKSYAICRDEKRASLGYKCIPYKRSTRLPLLNLRVKLLFVSLFHLN